MGIQAGRHSQPFFVAINMNTISSTLSQKNTEIISKSFISTC
ncbi:hypothetical protein SynROS8604_01634 [Synechococcus sp. ROS8604]|nr:hypothetical protein SynROS8604_01634 [Synechococcus sp. ROS8604]